MELKQNRQMKKPSYLLYKPQSLCTTLKCMSSSDPIHSTPLPNSKYLEMSLKEQSAGGKNNLLTSDYAGSFQRTVPLNTVPSPYLDFHLISKCPKPQTHTINVSQ